MFSLALEEEGLVDSGSLASRLGKVGRRSRVKNIYIYIFFRESIRDERGAEILPPGGRRRTRKWGGRFDGMGGGTRFVNQMILREAASMARGTNREREQV